MRSIGVGSPCDRAPHRASRYREASMARNIGRSEVFQADAWLVMMEPQSDVGTNRHHRRCTTGRRPTPAITVSPRPEILAQPSREVILQRIQDSRVSTDSPADRSGRGDEVVGQRMEQVFFGTWEELLEHSVATSYRYPRVAPSIGSASNFRGRTRDSRSRSPTATRCESH